MYRKSLLSVFFVSSCLFAEPGSHFGGPFGRDFGRPQIPVPSKIEQSSLFPNSMNFKFTEKAGTPLERTFSAVGPRSDAGLAPLSSEYELAFSADGDKRTARLKTNYKWPATVEFTFERDGKICPGTSKYETGVGFIGSMTCPSGRTYKVVLSPEPR